MTVLSTLVVQIVADTADFVSGLNKAGDLVGGFANDAVGGLSALGGTIVSGALAGAAAGAVALGVGLKGAADDAMAAQSVMAQTEAVLKSTGGVAGVTANDIADLAADLSEVTTFEDDAVQSTANMLLTFTSIGRDVFPSATATVLDMSQALGQDLKSSAIQLGKALQDPVAGISALARVGVNFTDEQKLMIEEMVKAGDTMGAQKFILAELNREFGGSAKAAAETAAGGWAQLMNRLGNLKEYVAGPFLSAFADLTNMLYGLAGNSAVENFIDDVGVQIGTLAQTAVDNLPKLAQSFQDGFAWLMENKGLVVAALAVVGAAIVAWAATSVIAIAPLIWNMMPVIAAILLIGGAAYLLYTAWTQNWGGIQEKTAATWAFLQFAFGEISQWLMTNIPAALAWMGQAWTNNVLPPIMAVWNWLSGVLLPFFQAFFNAWLAGWRLQIGIFGAAWNWLLGVIKPFTDFVGTFLNDVLRSNLIILQALVPWVGDYLAGGFNNLTDAIKGATQFLSEFADYASDIVGAVFPGLSAGFSISGAAGAGGSSGAGINTVNMRTMPGVQVTYVDNATVRSGDTNELVDKLSAAFEQYLRQVGWKP